MADNLPINFTIPGESAIASYPYQDVQDGTGYVHYFGAKDNDGYVLTTQNIYSEIIFSQVTANAGDATLLSQNFDVLFNAPKNVKGNLIANFPVMHDTSTSGLRKVNVTVTVYKVAVGGATTQIGTDTATEYSNTGTGQMEPNYRVRIVKCALTQTHFKVGESLRINVVIAVHNANGACIFYAYHDPAGRTYPSPTITDGTVPTQMSFYVPFRLNN